MRCLVYGVRCGSDKIYIGATCNLKNRKHYHSGFLRMGIHRNKELQSDFIKYGESAYSFEILEDNIPKEKLSEREFYWIRFFPSVYNVLSLPIKKRIPFKRKIINEGCIKRRKPVDEFLLDGTMVASYDSIYQCHKITGVSKADLHRHLAGFDGRAHLKGRIFRFKKTA